MNARNSAHRADPTPVTVIDRSVEAVVALPLTGPHGLIQSTIEDQLRGHRGAAAPAQDPAGIGINHERDVNPPGPQRHIRDVAPPTTGSARPTRTGTAPDHRADRQRDLDGGAFDLAQHRTDQPGLGHQSLHSATRHHDTFAVGLEPRLASAVNPVVRGINQRDLDQQHLVSILSDGGKLACSLVEGRGAICTPYLVSTRQIVRYPTADHQCGGLRVP